MMQKKYSAEGLKTMVYFQISRKHLSNLANLEWITILVFFSFQNV